MSSVCAPKVYCKMHYLWRLNCLAESYYKEGMSRAERVRSIWYDCCNTMIGMTQMNGSLILHLRHSSGSSQWSNRNYIRMDDVV